MNWAAISAISEAIGVIAVIASLVYVGYQIRQNTKIARANIVHETNTTSLRISELIAQDAELAGIYRRGTRGESLRGDDLERFIAIARMYLVWLEDVDAQWVAGLYFDEEDEADLVDYMAPDFARYFSTPELRQWWHTQGRLEFRPSFIAKVDRHVRSPE